jgi:hypothetical protein
MSAKWEEITDEFDAVSEDGEGYHILVYTTMIDVPQTRGNPNPKPLQGLKSARTTEGYGCNRIDDDTWEIVPLGLRVSRVTS